MAENVILSVPDLIKLLLAVIGSFTAVFFALQRYVAGQIKSSTSSVMSKFDRHAGALEGKLDSVVSGLADLKGAFREMNSGHGERLSALQRELERIDRRVTAVERGGP